MYNQWADMGCEANLHVFAMWEEGGVSRGNPRKQGEIMPTPQRKHWPNQCLKPSNYVRIKVIALFFFNQLLLFIVCRALRQFSISKQSSMGSPILLSKMLWIFSTSFFKQTSHDLVHCCLLLVQLHHCHFRTKSSTVQYGLVKINTNSYHCALYIVYTIHPT